MRRSICTESILFVLGEAALARCLVACLGFGILARLLDFAGRDGVPHITRSGSKQYNRADQHDQQIAVEAGARGQRSSGFCIEQVLSGKACLIVSRSRNTWRCFVRSSVRGSRFWMRLQTQLRSGRIAFAGLCLLGFFSGVQKQTHVQGFP
jgi:hypothetical protein